MSDIWIQSASTISALLFFCFFVLRGVVFTEERHCRDKYDQNGVGTKAAEGCFFFGGGGEGDEGD